MLSFNTTARLKQANSAIAASALIVLQAAFYRRLLKANDLLAADDMAWVSRPMLQEISLAPKLVPGQLLTDTDVAQLAELLFEAYTLYVNTYRDAGFPEPVRAALQALRSYEVTCT